MVDTKTAGLNGVTLDGMKANIPQPNYNNKNNKEESGRRGSTHSSITINTTSTSLRSHSMTTPSFSLSKIYFSSRKVPKQSDYL
jgi:hypothetical protein